MDANEGEGRLYDRNTALRILGIGGLVGARDRALVPTVERRHDMEGRMQNMARDDLAPPLMDNDPRQQDDAIVIEGVGRIEGDDDGDDDYNFNAEPLTAEESALVEAVPPKILDEHVQPQAHATAPTSSEFNEHVPKIQKVQPNKSAGACKQDDKCKDCEAEEAKKRHYTEDGIRLLVDVKGEIDWKARFANKTKKKDKVKCLP